MKKSVVIHAEVSVEYPPSGGPEYIVDIETKIGIDSARFGHLDGMTTWISDHVKAAIRTSELSTYPTPKRKK